MHLPGSAWSRRGSRRIPVGDPALQRLPGWELFDKRAQHWQRGSYLIVVQDRGESDIEVLFDLAHRSGGVDALGTEGLQRGSPVRRADGRLHKPLVRERAHQPARATPLAYETLPDLPHGQRSPRVTQDGDRLGLRGRQILLLEHHRKRPRPFTLRGEDEVAELLDRLHRHRISPLDDVSCIMRDTSSIRKRIALSTNSPTLVTVPCFSGAPWDERQLAPLRTYPVRTMRLPEAVDDIDLYADFLAVQVESLSDYVLVGDSFGAVISLALAIRQPTGLRGLVLSGGFAANPLPHWKAIAGRASRYAGGPLYRQVTLRIHARELASRFDHTAEVPHRQDDYRRLFVENTPRASYTARVTSVISFDVRDQLAKVRVPTLLITPADDLLVGAQAARELRQGIPNARETVLPSTGHMFRFTHPNLYGQTILEFLQDLDRPPLPADHSDSPATPRATV
jgi:pimeloyl-ACP methyl ester carboxylesterase